MENFKNHLRQPLHLYAIFGYLLPGFFFVSLLVVDYDISAILRSRSITKNVTLIGMKKLDLKLEYVLDFFSTGTFTSFKFIPVLLFLLFCYLLGHIVSAISSLILEKRIVKKWLGFPSDNLLSGKHPKYTWFFGNFRRTLESDMIEQIDSLANSTFKYNVNKCDYYWLFYSYIISERPYLAPRVHHFVNLYGFSRNVCGTILLYIVVRVLVLCFIVGSPIDEFVILVLSILFLGAFFMFWNYLKLFKRQAVDIYFLFISVRNDQLSITHDSSSK